MRQPSDSRRAAAARSRAYKAKVGIAAVGTLAFAVAVTLSRVSYAGHSKEPERPLLSPQPIYDVVRQNLLQSGVAMPATEPPEATTHSS